MVDPDGGPLDNAPAEAGGVFAGRATNREWTHQAAQPSGGIAKALELSRQRTTDAGLAGQGALGTAFLGPSPDGSGFAVFAAVTGDGAVVQIHVQDGVDGLAPPGTVAPARRRTIPA